MNKEKEERKKRFVGCLLYVYVYRQGKKKCKENKSSLLISGERDEKMQKTRPEQSERRKHLERKNELLEKYYIH